MKKISSGDNSLFKLAQSLKRKKARDREGLYLIEGIKPLKDAIATGQSIEHILLCGEKSPEVAINDMDCGAVLAENLFKKISDTENSQGVISIVKKNCYSNDDFIRIVQKKQRNIVVLDRLQDPGNIGTIIRTSEAAGYAGVMLIKGSGDVYGPKVVRAAAGSLFRVPVTYADDENTVENIIDKCNMRLVVTHMEAEKYYYDVEPVGRMALVIGNEGNGVSESLADRADIKVKIPMEGSIESLNAAVSAGILMYWSYKTNKVEGK